MLTLDALGDGPFALTYVKQKLRKMRLHEKEAPIRREVDLHSNLFEVQQQDEEVLVKMTAEGARVLSIYRKAIAGTAS